MLSEWCHKRRIYLQGTFSVKRDIATSVSKETCKANGVTRDVSTYNEPALSKET